jgi:hypothetical protein
MEAIMKYKVVGLPFTGTGDNPNYRGVAREIPSYIGDLPETHESNKFFLEKISEVLLRSAAIDDYNFCTEIINRYRKLSPPQYFEIIEITEPEQLPVYGDLFYGFDIEYKYHHSLISMALIPEHDYQKSLEYEDFRSIFPFFKIVIRYFRSVLNDFGLFNDINSASECLDALMALQRVLPGLFENESFIFRISGIWKVNY